MHQYLLSTFAFEGEVPGAPLTHEDMQAFMQRVMALEAEMDEKGAFVFGGALVGPEHSVVIEPGGSQSEAADGPFAAAEAHIAGFYIINAADHAEALAWADKVARATNHPIEVRPFQATGRVADQMGEMPGR